MLSRPTALGAILAHPLTEPSAILVPPVLAAGIAVSLVVAVSLFWPRRSPGPEVKAARGAGSDGVTLFHSWEARLTALQIVCRTAAVVLLALAVAAGRLGSLSELRNVAPALVIGAGWPLLLLASSVIGPVWRWVDPWDAATRALEGRSVDVDPGARVVWWALIPAAAWGWYLSANFRPVAPRSIGLALGLYTLTMVAGALVFGRVPWLSRVDVFGLFLGWLARLPRRRLGSWVPPAGAEAVLGVLAGGLLFGAIRLSDVWGGLNVVPQAELWAGLAVVGSGGLGAGLLMSLAVRARRAGAAASVAVAAVPATGAIALALALSRNRFTTSLQVLPHVLTDPFGRGWDPLGLGDTGLVAAPLGETGLVIAQVVVLAVGHLVGAVVVAANVEPRSRGPATAALTALAAASVMAVTA